LGEREKKKEPSEEKKGRRLYLSLAEGEEKRFMFKNKTIIPPNDFDGKGGGKIGAPKKKQENRQPPSPTEGGRYWLGGKRGRK